MKIKNLFLAVLMVGLTTPMLGMDDDTNAIVDEDGVVHRPTDATTNVACPAFQSTEEIHRNEASTSNKKSNVLQFDFLGELQDYEKFQQLKPQVLFKERNDKGSPYKVTKVNPIKFHEPNLEYRPGGQSGCIDTNEESVEFSRPVLLVGGIPLGTQHGIVTHEGVLTYLASREKDKEKRASGVELSEHYGDGETRGKPIGVGSSVRFQFWTNPTKYGWAAIGGITCATIGCAAYLSGLFSKK